MWQFCADLLDDDTYNPDIIKWLNKERGIFKIVKPEKVADLWGAQKNRRSDKKMNYEKMARGMRFVNLFLKEQNLNLEKILSFLYYF